MALTVALAATACGGGDDDGGSGGGDAAGGEIVRYGYDLEAQFTNTFDIAKSTGDCDSIVDFHIYDTLVHKLPGNELGPGLAESWKVIDLSTVEFTLREGLTFHDGTPVDAEAVKQGLERSAENEQLSDLSKISEFEIVDPRTIRLHFEEPIAVQFPATMAARDGMIMAPASTDERPIGAGPFSFVTYQPGQKITLERFDDYWNEDGYAFDGIEFVQTATGPPAVTALKAGDIDIARIEAESYESLKDDNNYGVAVQPSGAYLQFEFRQKNSVFADKLVRQAVAHAIDREKINEVVQVGLGEVASQPFAKDSPAYIEELADRYPYDPEKAKELLAQAGYSDGFEFTMAIPGGNIANMERQATLLVEMLDAVGITANVERILGSDIGTQYYIVGRGDAFAAAELDTTFPTGKLYNNYGEFQFVAIYNGAEREDITKLMLDAQATTDLEETYELVRQGVEIAVEEALDVPIAFMPQFLAYDKSRITGELGAQTNICDPPNLSKIEVG